MSRSQTPPSDKDIDEMSVEEPGEEAKACRNDTHIEQSKESETQGGESWQDPPEQELSNDQYNRESHKCTEQKERTGLRCIDKHASWKEVYRACHVGVGVDD